MKNVTLYKVLTPMLALSLLVGCNDSKNEISEDVVYKGFRLDLDESGLSQEQKDIAAKVNAEQAIPFTEITNAFVIEHGNIYYQRIQNAGGLSLEGVSSSNGSVDLESNNENPSKGFADAMFAVMKLNFDMQKIDINADLNTIKVQSEAFLKEMQGGKDLVYNVEATSAYDLLTLNKMQCYSGTVYHTLQYRSGLRKQYVNKNPVVIYTSGHVLPGYIANGELVGVETTAAGRAEIRYGVVAKLNSPMRVIDAEIFALSEIFKNHLKNQVDFLDNALKQSAEKYQIPLDRLEALVAAAHTSGGTVSAKSLMTNSDIMSFGNANVSRGDKQRDIIERQTNEQPLLPEDQPVFITEGPVVLNNQIYSDMVLFRENAFMKNANGFEEVTLLFNGPTEAMMDFVRNPKKLVEYQDYIGEVLEEQTRSFRRETLYCIVNDPMASGSNETAVDSVEIKAKNAAPFNVERSISFDCGHMQFNVRVQMGAISKGVKGDQSLFGFNMMLSQSNNVNYIEKIAMLYDYGYGSSAQSTFWQPFNSF